MTWRVARSLDQLLRQINILYPNRDISSDGGIGNEEHQSRSSDHNPWVWNKVEKKWIVTARDFTNDPIHHVMSRELAHSLIDSRDERIKYVIANGQICSGAEQDKPAWVWRRYVGKNPHDHHFHVSVRSSVNFYDDVSPWRFKAQPAPPEVQNILVPR